MVVGQPQPKDKDEAAATSTPTGNVPKSSGSSVDDTYANDDWFDLDQYKKAAQVAYDFSIGKMQEQGNQERETIGKGAFEQRMKLTSNSSSSAKRRRPRLPPIAKGISILISTSRFLNTG